MLHIRHLWMAFRVPLLYHKKRRRPGGYRNYFGLAISGTKRVPFIAHQSMVSPYTTSSSYVIPLTNTSYPKDALHVHSVMNSLSSGNGGIAFREDFGSKVQMAPSGSAKSRTQKNHVFGDTRFSEDPN